MRVANWPIQKTAEVDSKHYKIGVIQLKYIKLYNVIFPIWFLMFFPPIILVTLAGNFIIDSLVVLACYRAFKLTDTVGGFKAFYKGSIIKVWLYGFLADFAGAAILFISGTMGDYIGLPHEIISAIHYDPFGHPAATIITIFAMLVSAALIYLFNYRTVFKKRIENSKIRFKVVLTLAVVTMPWTFLLPTKWFY
jgi:hypothetical protein